MIIFLSSWVKNLSLSLIIVSILEMILPNSKTKKYIKMVMGLYILFSIIAPFIENSNKFNLDYIDVDFYENSIKEVSSSEINQTSMDNRLNQIYKEELEKDIESKLKEKGYEVESCKVTAKISDENSGIEKIVIKIKEKSSVELEENKSTEENNSNDESKSSIEDRIVTEVEKIKEVQKIKVGSSKNENNKEDEQEDSSITKTDINIIKKFLIEEYGVNEKCLRIS